LQNQRQHICFFWYPNELYLSSYMYLFYAWCSLPNTLCCIFGMCDLITMALIKFQSFKHIAIFLYIVFSQGCKSGARTGSRSWHHFTRSYLLLKIYLTTCGKMEPNKTDPSWTVFY
jgi:hypothetical protein